MSKVMAKITGFISLKSLLGLSLVLFKRTEVWQFLQNPWNEPEKDSALKLLSVSLPLVYNLSHTLYSEHLVIYRLFPSLASIISFFGSYPTVKHTLRFKCFTSIKWCFRRKAFGWAVLFLCGPLKTNKPSDSNNSLLFHWHNHNSSLKPHLSYMLWFGYLHPIMFSTVFPGRIFAEAKAMGFQDDR